MLRRLIVVTALTAGMSIAAVLALATPALAKGPSLARITGPGLSHAIVISGNGEPGQLGTLAVLAEQTGLFTAMFGSGGNVPAPVRLRGPLPEAALGPRFTIVYTVPGVTPRPGQQFGQIRQDLYPRAAGGPVVYTPSGQSGFGQPLLITGWTRASPRLTRSLARLGVPLGAAGPAAAHQAGTVAPGWLIAAAVAIVAAALAATALWVRHRRPATAPGSEPRTS
ncbi:MAG TPA: hypothetical protein VIX86_04120 [Streptosporangiaceae bacterium]